VSAPKTFTPIILKTAIVLDPSGTFMGGPEDEIRQHWLDFSDLLEPATLEIYQPGAIYPEALKPGTDLVLFDWGGMMLGNSLMQDNSRRLIQYAQYNPSTLCVVVSTFTWGHGIQYEMEELELTKPHNLTCRFWIPTKPYSGEREPDDWDPIPAWFREFHNLPRVDPCATSLPKLKTPGRKARP
jgi:hypothetical protein